MLKYSLCNNTFVKMSTIYFYIYLCKTLFQQNICKAQQTKHSLNFNNCICNTI